MLVGVGVSCRISYCIISYLYVSFSGFGKRKLFFLLSFSCNYVVSVRRWFPLPLGACDRLHYVIVALPYI